MAEWSNAHAWKACGVRKGPREFESRSLRHFVLLSKIRVSAIRTTELTTHLTTQSEVS